MRVHAAACVVGVILAIATIAPGALAQTTSGARLGSQVQRESVAKRLNDGAEFELLCRGGPGLRFRISKVSPTSGGWSLWRDLSNMTVDFQRSTQSPDPSGRNLLPGQCSPANFALRDFDRTQIQDIVSTGSPDSWDKSVKSAERRPDSDNIPLYLQDPNHYWTFTAVDSGEAALQAGDSRYWKPEDYKGVIPSSAYRPAANASAAVSESTAALQASASRFGASGARIEGRAGTPAVPVPASPAAPESPPPVVHEPPAVVPVVFAPPLLQDGAQLWACADAAAGEAEAGACSGEASAHAYCLLRDAQSGPDLIVSDAQPGTPVRAVDGDACGEDICRVVSHLQCDR